MSDSRQVAFAALKAVTQKDVYAEVALDRALAKSGLQGGDRALATELVYGCVRRRRSLDALIDAFAKKPAAQQPPDLRVLLHLGLYQLAYLDRVAAAFAVDSTVNLAKANRLGGLAGVTNGILRQYLRQRSSDDPLPIALPEDPVQRLAVRHSYPDWIVRDWCDRLGFDEAEQLGQWFNQSPSLYLRVNPLRSDRQTVQEALTAAGVTVEPVADLSQGLKVQHSGSVSALPGYAEGWWTVQDRSAQWVTELLAPQPGETVADACAAPGGKTTHIAELMGDTGKVWACDRTASRLKKLRHNCDRLGLRSVEIVEGDSRTLSQFQDTCDRLLLDAPCSGLGTLHRRADLRWRQTPESVAELAQLQGELLAACATWVKPGGVLVYATCTVSPTENEGVVQPFLAAHPNWQIDPPAADSAVAPLATPEGWVRVYPHRQNTDGFFMVRLRRSPD